MSCSREVCPSFKTTFSLQKGETTVWPKHRDNFCLMTFSMSLLSLLFLVMASYLAFIPLHAVMDIMLILNRKDHGFDLWWSRSNQRVSNWYLPLFSLCSIRKTNGAKIGWLYNRKRCSSVATCLLVICCFIELSL